MKVSLLRLFKSARFMGTLMIFFCAVIIWDVGRDRRLIQFDTPTEFRAFVEKQQLHYWQGSWDSLYVADHPVALKHRSRLNVGQMKTASWRGIVWVTPYRLRDGTQSVICPESLGVPYRIWGNLLVAGDELWMDRLEEIMKTGK